MSSSTACASARTSGSAMWWGNCCYSAEPSLLKKACIHLKREGGDGGVRVHHADVRLLTGRPPESPVQCRGTLAIARHLSHTKSRAVKLEGKVCNTLLVSIVAINCLKWVFLVTEELDSDQICRTVSETVWELLQQAPKGVGDVSTAARHSQQNTDSVLLLLCTHRQAAVSSQKCRSEMPTTFSLLSRETKPQPEHRKMFRRRILFPMALFCFVQSQTYS